jgi:hypothetical protein
MSYPHLVKSSGDLRTHRTWCGRDVTGELARKITPDDLLGRITCGSCLHSWRRQVPVPPATILIVGAANG